MNFNDLVQEGAIDAELQSSDRDAVIKQLVDMLVSIGDIKKKDAKGIFDLLIKRENEASTGIGKGVAVPHVKHSGIKKVVAAIGVSQNGIDFNSLDKEPVYAVILMISPEKDPDAHLKAMEIVFKNLQKEDFRRFLCQARSTEDVRDLLCEVDEGEI
ncbi:EIIABC-Fru [Limihaloglobus sulfuriphilus]|uniref:EIIABC-Fru n=1 Tax=Limihaloglobus sulfuriphilus TaxID=1851148 RepID=A0A1Q2MGR0_9BACT|nr:PTS sugar transporter subunit IIA [Limihaloglobus sulfuriphilus]AQQ71870.1 EIIABC-Fru [Limihaloglobus sulfuriphilus]